MTPGVYDLKLYRGDTYGWRVVLWEDAVGGDPVDLTGATAKAEFRSKSGASPIVTFDCTIVGTNVIDMALTPDSWVGAPKSGIWDLQVTFPGGVVRTFLAGKVAVTPDVTDSTVPVALRQVKSA